MHIKPILNKGFILVPVLFLAGCSEEQPTGKYVARVENSYLYEKDFQTELDTLKISKTVRDEYIRNWIDKEILFLEAEKKGLNNKEEYKRLLRKAEKEIASILFVKQLTSEGEMNITDEDLQKYYRENGEVFRLKQRGFVLNLASFKSFNTAVNFYYSTLEKGWELSAAEFDSNPEKLNVSLNSFNYEYELQTGSLLRVCRELLTGETSPIIPVNENEYVLLQMVQQVEKGAIPPFSAIKDEVGLNYYNMRKREVLEEFFAKAYSKYEIEIKK
ncbi:MAG: hypothetical protein L6Q59_15290 [Ignavibacteriaceae bacterium]|nr:hypothetical protein [Ignavibacteriaceae bacterium]